MQREAAALPAAGLTPPAGRRGIMAMLAADNAADGRLDSPKSRILIVEDDWLIATSMEACLEQEGYDVIGIAMDGEQALARAKDGKPDLALMDIQLGGGGNGLQVARRLEEEFGIRSLFVSANIDARAKAAVEDLHPLGWLPKPFSDQQLIDAVKGAAAEE